MPMVIFSANANIRSSINRLQTYLGAHKNQISPVERPRVLEKGGGLIAISAPGAGSPKLVSIVELTKRHVKPGSKDDSEKEKGPAETWYSYMSLGRIYVKARSKTNTKKPETKREQAAEDEEENAFQSLAETRRPEGDADGHEDDRMIPDQILTIWWSRQSIPEFKTEFGEDIFEVRTLKEDA